MSELAIRTIGDPLQPSLSSSGDAMGSLQQCGVLTLTVTLTMAALGYGGPWLWRAVTVDIRTQCVGTFPRTASIQKLNACQVKDKN